MFRERKRWADASAARFAESRAKIKRMGRVSFREGFPVRDERFPRNASAFGLSAGKTTTALMSKTVIKNLLKGKLGVKTVTGNGIDLFAGLLDKGVQWALNICKDIHDRAIMKGAGLHTFGTDLHMQAANESGHMKDMMAIGSNVIDKRSALSLASMARHEKALAEGKGQKRLSFQAMPALTKAIYTKMNKAAKLINVPKAKISDRCSDFYERIIAAGGTEALKQQLGGLALKDLATIAAPFLSDANLTFFPAGPILAAASEEKWMNYETVFIMAAVLGFEGINDLFAKFHLKDDRTHIGFYSKWKLAIKDIRDNRAGTLSQQKKATLQRALLKAFVASRHLGKNDLLNLSGKVMNANFIIEYNKGADALKRGVFPPVAEPMVQNIIAELEKFEGLYH